ncbi:hypothetical protein ACTFIZ_007211 [Dictyostelium cf. discoideum]
MYCLYKKVFNNNYLFNLIFYYVKYQDLKFRIDKSYLNYDKILNSYKTSDLTIEIMLSNGMLNLFDSYVDHYFKVVKNDRIRYWYYNAFNNLTEMDIKTLLNYKELGFKRFELIFKQCKNHFKKYKKFILLYAASGGDFEIYDFLLKNQFKLPTTINSADSIFQKTVYFQETTIFNSGGNLEIFISLLNYYDDCLYDDQNLDLKKCSELIIWLLKMKYTKLLIYFIQLKPFLYCSHMNSYLFFSSLAINYSNMELAKYLVDNNKEISFFKNSFNKDNLNHLKVPSINIVQNSKFERVSMIGSNMLFLNPLKQSDFNMEIFQFIWSNYEFELIRLGEDIEVANLAKLEYFNNFTGTFNNISFEILKYNNNMIRLLTLNKSFIPSFEDFSYLIENELEFLLNNIPKVLLLFNRVAEYCCLVSFDLEYFNYFLKNSPKEILIKWEMPIQCYETKYEILECLVSDNRYCSKIPTMDLHFRSCKNAFFGDLNAIKLYEKVSKSNHNSFCQPLFQSSILNGYFNIVKYLMEKVKPKTKILLENIRIDKWESYLSKEYPTFDHFQIFQYFVNYELDPINQITQSISKNVFLKLNDLFELAGGAIDSKAHDKFVSKYHHVFNQINCYHIILLQSPYPSIGKIKEIYQDFLIFQQQYHLNSNTSIDKNELIRIFKSSNYSILNYMIYNLNISPPSSSSSSSSSSSDLINLISQYDFTRLCFFIENDKQFVISNIIYLIEHSLNLKNGLILQVILNSKQFSNDFKLILFINSVIYSISNSNSLKDLWVFDLNIEKSLNEHLPIYEQFLNIINNKDNHIHHLSILNIKLLQNKSKLYIEPNLSILKKKNINIIFVIKSLITFMKSSTGN